MQGSPIECMRYLETCDQSKRYEVREARKKRTLTQNAYYWSMLNQLAAKLGMPESEVHLNMLREWGVADFFVVGQDVDVPAHFRYFDIVSSVGAARTVKAYKRSSRMDSAEFTRLIQGMREECELQGIDVKTPEEIAMLRFVEPKEE